jgi:gliding motility-associated-like protein
VSGNGSEQCYYAIAIPAGVKNVSIKSISNKVCIKQEDKLFIPDAFNPLSKIDANKTFRPIVAYINTSTYKFTIFNRLSEPIFQTSDINKAWDGTVKGEMVAEGTYIYDVKYKNSDGKSIEKRGTFYVVFNEK